MYVLTTHPVLTHVVRDRAGGWSGPWVPRLERGLQRWSPSWPECPPGVGPTGSGPHRGHCAGGGWRPLPKPTRISQGRREGVPGTSGSASRCPGVYPKAVGFWQTPTLHSWLERSGGPTDPSALAPEWEVEGFSEENHTLDVDFLFLEKAEDQLEAERDSIRAAFRDLFRRLPPSCPHLAWSETGSLPGKRTVKLSTRLPVTATRPAINVPTDAARQRRPGA